MNIENMTDLEYSNYVSSFPESIQKMINFPNDCTQKDYSDAVTHAEKLHEAISSNLLDPAFFMDLLLASLEFHM